MQNKVSNPNKRVSAFIKNSDPNAYRAYKQVTKETSTYNAKDLSRLLTIKNDAMKYPFQLTAERFRWQNNKNRGETIQLEGNLSKYSFDTSTLGKWDKLMNKSNDRKPTTKFYLFNFRSVDKRVQENKVAIRTLNPKDIDVFFLLFFRIQSIIHKEIEVIYCMPMCHLLRRHEQMGRFLIF